MELIPFDRVKRVVLENLNWRQPDLATCAIGAIRAYVGDGVAMTAKDVRSAIMARMRSFVEGADIRCLGELLELCPKGWDNRLPGWLYGEVDAYFGDEGWALVPRRAA